MLELTTISSSKRYIGISPSHICPMLMLAYVNNCWRDPIVIFDCIRHTVLHIL